jgi:hypothetical protein
MRAFVSSPDVLQPNIAVGTVAQLNAAGQPDGVVVGSSACCAGSRSSSCADSIPVVDDLSTVADRSAASLPVQSQPTTKSTT